VIGADPAPERRDRLRQDDRVPTLRVLSVDARTTGRDRAALGRLIGDAGPDAVCVHFAPHLGRWRQKAAALARRSGRVVVTAGGRGSGANLLLSTLGVDAVLTGERRFTSRGRRTNPPGAALALLRVEGQPVVLASAMLAGNAAERLAQAQELQSAMDGLVPGNPPGIVSAVGTDRPGTAAWQSLTEGRVAVGGRFFVDRRIAVAEVKEVSGTPPFAAVLAELTL
jgi:hypothetical protein